MADPAFPDALPALSRLHWYVIERVLGQGGFGITYVARDTNLDQRVAIKEYLPIEFATRMPDATVRSRTDDLRDRYRWGLERFMQEARTLARFDHPSIVRVHSVFEFNNTAYMVMRFEEGINLAALLDRRGTLPEAELLHILMPVLDGLELVHDAGFIHRDIKPDNVHIAEDGRAVLLDFGSARQALGNAHTLTILVAPGYAPFEQYYSDPGNQGPWTDIYGLGATCYRAIAGRAPLDAVSRSKGILGSTQEMLVPASVIGAGRYSGRLLAAIDHALEFAEKDRPQTIAEWRRELAGGPGAAAAAAAAAAATGSNHLSATAAPPKAPSATGHGELAAASESELSRGPKAPPDKRPPFTNGVPARRLVTVAILGVAILAGGAMTYLITAGRSDETSLKIAALEKQIRDKDRADAEREQAAKQRQQDEERQRREQDQQAQAALEKSRAELAAKRATPERSRAEKKQPDDAAKRPPPARASPNASSPPPAAPARGNDLPVAPPPPGSPSAGVPSQPPAERPPAGGPSRLPDAPTSAGLDSQSVAIAPEASTATAAGTLADRFADAERAMAAKRYTDALAIVRPLADAGNARAQVMLGDQYADGRGIARDEGAAASWYEKAALQGETGAQLKLAVMYAKGIGVTRNNNLAYVWYGTAARLGSHPAKLEQERIAALLQPMEREQADRLIESSVAHMARKP